MTSRFSIRGHPLHPMLVPLPIGMLAWAFLSNLIYAVSGEPLWYDIGFWTTWAGVVALIPAASAGLGDYLTMAIHRVMRLATLHLAVNLAVLALFTISGLLALGDTAREGPVLVWLIAIQAAGIAALADGGWIGGTMVYQHGLAVTPQAGEAAARGRRPAEREPRPECRPTLERGKRGT